jgi:hypothetical protein
VGECLATAARIDGTNLTSWHDAWVGTAERVCALAEAELAAGRVETATGAFLRASNYFRTAGVMLMGTPVDERLQVANARQTEVFRRGAALLAQPPEILAVPYQDTTLPGYHFRAGRDERPRPTVVLIEGYDGTSEELYFLTGRAALARGYNVLAFDGPGQGAALLQQQLVLRPDYETVVAAVLDFSGDVRTLTRAESGSSAIVAGQADGGLGSAARAARPRRRRSGRVPAHLA